jgi:hypothetical protein
MKKLLFVNQTLGGTGGAEVFARDLLEDFLKEKIEIGVITNNHNFLNLFQKKIFNRVY